MSRACLVIALTFAACAPEHSPERQVDELATTPVTTDPAQAPAALDSALPVITVYKSPTCGCCKAWVEHVKAAGFVVDVHDVADVTPVKDDAGVPGAARSCHTAIVNGYAIEGHVPAAEIKRMLSEHPAIAGLAVPGMPAGSPGMEIPGRPAEPYDVIAFTADGKTSVYGSH